MNLLLYALILFAIVVNGLVLYIAVRRFFERNIAQGNIHFDYDKMQAELDEVFAPVSRPASKR